MNSKKITSLLKKVKTIAIVGASTNPQRDSHKVMEFLIGYGYKVFPVNPNESNSMILKKRLIWLMFLGQVNTFLT